MDTKVFCRANGCYTPRPSNNKLNIQMLRLTFMNSTLDSHGWLSLKSIRKFSSMGSIWASYNDNNYFKITSLGCFYVTAILSWGYGWGWVEADLHLRLKWDWDEIEWKFGWNWVEVELSWSWDKLTLNKGKNWVFIGVELWFKICFRSTYIAEQLLFFMLFFILSN